MEYKTYLKNNLGHILGVSLLDILTSLAMVYAGYSLSFFILHMNTQEIKQKPCSMPS